MMYDDAEESKEVPHCYTDETHKTLGDMLAPDDTILVKLRECAKLKLNLATESELDSYGVRTYCML